MAKQNDHVAEFFSSKMAIYSTISNFPLRKETDKKKKFQKLQGSNILFLNLGITKDCFHRVETRTNLTIMPSTLALEMLGQTMVVPTPMSWLSCAKNDEQ